MAGKQQLISSFEESLNVVANYKGHIFVNQVRPILLCNLDNGRVGYFLDNHAGAVPDNYVWRVSRIFEQTHPFIQRIQHDRCCEDWGILFANLRDIAFALLRKKKACYIEDKEQLAHDVAATASAKILKIQFPYDTSFLAWTYKFVEHAFLQEMRDRFTSDRNRSLEVPLLSELLEVLAHPTYEHPEIKIIRIEELKAAIRRLAPRRQRVIYYRYKKDLNSKEIASLMHITANAVNQLHFKAIQQLRDSLR